MSPMLKAMLRGGRCVMTKSLPGEWKSQCQSGSAGVEESLVKKTSLRLLCQLLCRLGRASKLRTGVADNTYPRCQFLDVG